MTDTGHLFRVAALYRFATVADPAGLRVDLAARTAALGLCGTLIVASEGINGTVAGSEEGIDALLSHLRSLPGFDALDVKLSTASRQPFGRMKVKLKREIVTMGVDGIDPTPAAGTYVEPDAWNALIGDPDTIVIDTRNGYETAIGRFRGAVDPETETFRSFPQWAQDNREKLSGRRVAMYCTGGIRCEKATAYVRSLGIEDVFHLKGGILRYLETVPASESLWDGECFVFDERVAVAHGLAEGSSVRCKACGVALEPGAIEASHGRCPRCTSLLTG